MARIDPVLYNMAEEIVKPGSIVWDVSANVGLFSFCASALSGQSGLVLAIEPDFWLAHLINRSSQRLEAGRYRCAPVEVLCASISDSNRISKLAIAKRARASNYLIEAAGSSEAKGARCVQPTVSVALDSLLEYFPAPSVLKIDAETHELGVLKGAERVLKEIRPTIWCEVWEQNSSELTKLLHTAKYNLYGAEVQPHRPIERAWFHTLAISELFPAGLIRSSVLLPRLQNSKQQEPGLCQTMSLVAGSPVAERKQERAWTGAFAARPWVPEPGLSAERPTPKKTSKGKSPPQTSSPRSRHAPDPRSQPARAGRNSGRGSRFYASICRFEPARESA